MLINKSITYTIESTHSQTYDPYNTITMETDVSYTNLLPLNW